MSRNGWINVERRARHHLRHAGRASATARRCRCSASTPACSARTRGTHEPRAACGAMRAVDARRLASRTSPFSLSISASRRVGVATGNTLTRTATPLTTVAAEGEARLAAIGRADRRMAARRRSSSACRSIPTARRTTNTERARRFGRQLQARFGLPVHEVDERYTTTEAQARRRAPTSTPRAAAIILEQHLAGLLTRLDKLDAEALYAELLAGVRGLLKPDGVLVGIWSGGAWLAERLQQRPRPRRRAGRDLERAAPRRLLAARPVGRRRPHQAAVRDRGPPHRPGRRRALHRPHDPRRGQRALRLRPAGERRRWRCWSTAAAASCRSAPPARRRRSSCRPGQRLSLARDDAGKFSFEIR